MKADQVNVNWYKGWAADHRKSVSIQCSDRLSLSNLRSKILSYAKVRDHIIQTTQLDGNLLKVEYLGFMGENKKAKGLRY